MVFSICPFDPVLQRLGERALEFIFKLVAARKEKRVVANEVKELGGIKVAQ